MPSSSSSALPSASSTSSASQIDPTVFRDALDLLSTASPDSSYRYICNAIKAVLYSRNPDYQRSEADPYFALLFDLFDDLPPPPPEEGSRYLRAIFGYGGFPEYLSNRIFALLFLLEILDSPYEPTT